MIRFVSVLLLTLVVLFACSKKEEHKIASEEEEYSISSGMEGQTLRAKLNYDSLLVVVDELTEMVVANPGDIYLKEKLVDTCYDTTHKIIFASGRGKPLEGARTNTLAKNYAQKAAAIEAYRWALYIKKWRVNPAVPELGTLSGDLPSGHIVSKKELPDSSVQVLVEVNVEN